MAIPYGKSFQYLSRLLRRKFPLSCPLRLVGKQLLSPRLCGCCVAYLSSEGMIDRFVIEIDTGLTTPVAVETLLHEYAHAMDQDLNGVALEPHRDSWGVCYAQLWRTYVDGRN